MPLPALPSIDDAVLDLLPVPACLCDASSGRILRCNTQAIALWGQPVQTETRIHDILRFVGPDGAPLPPNATPLAKVIEGTAAKNQPAVIDRPGQSAVRVSLHIAPVRTIALAEAAAGLLVFQNEPEPGRRESLLVAQDRALEMIARGAPLPGILDTLTAIVEQHAGGAAVPAILLLDPDGQHLRHVSGAGLPDHFKKAVDELRVGPGVGTSQAAAFSRETVVTGDINGFSRVGVTQRAWPSPSGCRPRGRSRSSPRTTGCSARSIPTSVNHGPRQRRSRRSSSFSPTRRPSPSSGSRRRTWRSRPTGARTSSWRCSRTSSARRSPRFAPPRTCSRSPSATAPSRPGCVRSSNDKSRT